LFTVEFPESALPDGAVAVWTIDGAGYSNLSTLSLEQPGTYQLRVDVLDTSNGGQLLWSETLVVTVQSTEPDDRSIARIWNEQNLAAIRIDFPDPTKHARNLFASSVAMWDAWAAFDTTAVGVLHNEAVSAGDIVSARREAISYAAYRVLSERYKDSVNATTTQIRLNVQMLELGYDPFDTSLEGDTPAALGNRVAQAVLNYTSSDGWNDFGGFMGSVYEPLNEPLVLDESGTGITFPNNWQPLLFKEAFTQNQQPTDLIQEFLGPHWGAVRPFALDTLPEGELLHLDPGPPPQIGSYSDAAFKQGNVDVIFYSSLLDPADGLEIDISPRSMGNSTLGTNDGTGYPVNPHTGQPYEEQVVRHADFGRVLAEFWADGPESETPPGHWNVLANELHHHPNFERRFMGQGEELDALEWDVKLYLAMNGALHDAAIAAWGCKRVYDFVRPISSIRYMGGRGQSSDPEGTSYDPHGLPLIPGLIEVVTPESSAPGQRHESLAAHAGEIAIFTWSAGQDGQPGGVGWILASDWLPYQRDTFVTPAFPGYVSGHSTFSRAAAEVLARMTGSIYFPGGLGTFTAHQDEFLEFEQGPSTDVVLQWATYYDAADQAGLSRLYGGIHVPADDTPGRVMGSVCGITAWNLANGYFDGSIAAGPVEARIASFGPEGLRLEWTAIRGAFYKVEQQNLIMHNNYINQEDWVQATETTGSAELPPPDDTAAFYRIIRDFRAP
jgi:hypothetical protein